MKTSRNSSFLPDSSDLRTRVIDLHEFQCEDTILIRFRLFADAWDPERFERASRVKGEKTLSLPHPVPIHLVYWTAAADEGGVSFFLDVYGADSSPPGGFRGPGDR